MAFCCCCCCRSTAKWNYSLQKKKTFSAAGLPGSWNGENSLALAPFTDESLKVCKWQYVADSVSRREFSPLLLLLLPLFFSWAADFNARLCTAHFGESWLSPGCSFLPRKKKGQRGYRRDHEFSLFKTRGKRRRPLYLFFFLARHCLRHIKVKNFRTVFLFFKRSIWCMSNPCPMIIAPVR